MDRVSKHAVLKQVSTGSFYDLFYHNTVNVLPDLSRMLVFHTNDVDLGQAGIYPCLYVTADISEARKQWSIPRKTRRHVNVMSFAFDEVPTNFLHWSNGDKYERLHGGAGCIMDVQHLKHEAYVAKPDLNAKCADLGYVSLHDIAMEEVAKYLLYGRELKSYLPMRETDQAQELCLFNNLFHAGSS